MEEKMLLTDQEVADMFQVSRTTIWNWVRANKGFPTPKKFNGATRWLREDVLNYIKGEAE